MEYEIGIHDINGKQVEVEQDMDAFDPRAEYDHVGTMVCWHGRYQLGDEQPGRDVDPQKYYEREIEQHEEGGVVLPLYLYDHSGITMSTAPFSCPWDSGQVGFIYCTAEDVEREWGGDLEAAERYLKGEVEEYDQYLRGDVYAVLVYSLQRCSLGHIHRKIEDSMSGLYGLERVEEWINEYFHEKEEVA